jgi:hypothetical protein
MAEGRSKGAIRATLGHRDFRLLLGRQAISNTGDWLYNVSLIVYVLEVTHTWVAATNLVRFLPYVLFGTFGGVGAFADAEGTLISGGTAQGVSTLAADVSSTVHTVRSVGYLPAALPDGVAEDDRYGELRRSDGEGFSPSEPLAYWRDLIDAAVRAFDVRVLAIGGGRLTALEARIALSLGADVAVVAGSGGSSGALVRDPTWGTSARLSEIEPSAERLRSFLQPNSD